MKNKAFGIIIIGIAFMLMLSGCGSGAVGYWTIQEIKSGDITMGPSDAENIGLPIVGSVKLQKSGKCEVILLGEESEGEWTQNEKGKIKINADSDIKLSGRIDDEGIMTLKDPQGTEYTLEK